MTSAIIQNVYHRRLVADTASKACWICYKPSSTVLITPDQDDWFHICVGHLNDTKFATAKDAAEIAEKKRQEALDKEIEAVKKEYEEKLRKRIAKKEKAGDKSEDGPKKKKQDKEDEADKDAKEKEEKIRELEGKKDVPKHVIDGPRIFELHRQFYQMRLQKKHDVEMALKNRERLRAPGTFPSVPVGEP